MSSPMPSRGGAVRAWLEQDRAEHGWEPRCDSWLTAFDRGFSRRLAGAGFVGMTLPAEHGGRGCSHTERLAVIEELLLAGAPVAAHWMADRQVGPSLLRHGAPELCAELLPGIARAETVFCIALSEPDSGSDLASLTTRAEPCAEGWRVTGQKIWVSHAHRADYAYLLARTDLAAGRHGGLTELIVDMGSPGITVRPILDLAGRHHFNEVFFDGVVVPAGRVVGRVGEGWPQMMAQLAYERSGPERILSTAPLLQRLVTGTEGEPAVGDLVARMTVLRRLGRRVAEEMDAGRAPSGLAALVKLAGTRLEQEVADVAAAHLGVEADPLSDDPAAALLAGALAGAPTFTLRGGTSEIMVGIAARELVA